MNRLFRKTFTTIAVLTVLCAAEVASVQAQGAKLQIDQLDALVNKATETVDVKLDERLMQTTAKFFSGKDPDGAEIRELIKGVKGIYVKSFTFDKEGQYSQADIDSVTAQLRGAEWSKIIGVTSKKDGDNVEVYLNAVGEQINGLVVLSLEPKEFTVINIVGPINLEKLAQLEGQFGVPYLNLPPPKPKGENIRKHP